MQSDQSDLSGIWEHSFIKSTWGSIKNAILGCSVAALFGLLILVASLLSATSPRAADQQGLTVTATQSATAIEYYLPYPGMLPDNSLYRIKAARDKMRLWVTFDPVKKSELELAYADKRINAAIALTEGGKGVLGASTITKAEKYLEQATNRAVALRTAGQDTNSLLLTLSKASKKHLEIIDSLLPHLSGDDQAVIRNTRRTTQLGLEKIDQVLMEN